jgi:hypothetical protein
MENDNLNEKRNDDEPEKKNKNGLNIAYDEEEIKKFLPHLMEEIVDKKKSIKIDSFKTKIEIGSEEFKTIQKNCLPSELINPGAIDFIRRCTKKEEAIEILDYLLKRNEISSEDYNNFKNEIMMDGGLKNLIERCGGPKNPGYYIDKYYKKNNTNQKFKSNKD